MELTAGELITEIRAKRDALLKESDYTQLPDSPFSNEEKMAWVVYRQELRDFPQTCDFNNPVWPIKP